MDDWEAAVKKYGDRLTDGLNYYYEALSKIKKIDIKKGERPQNYNIWLDKLIKHEGNYLF